MQTHQLEIQNYDEIKTDDDEGQRDEAVGARKEDGWGQADLDADHEPPAVRTGTGRLPKPSVKDYFEEIGKVESLNMKVEALRREKKAVEKKNIKLTKEIKKMTALELGATRLGLRRAKVGGRPVMNSYRLNKRKLHSTSFSRLKASRRNFTTSQRKSEHP